MKQRFSAVWNDLMSLHLLAWDALHCGDSSNHSHPKYIKAPALGRKMLMTRPMVVQHRVFNLLDADSDGVISQSDVGAWLTQHLELGSLSHDAIHHQMLRGRGSHQGAVVQSPTHEQLFEWLEKRVWDLLKEGFAPQSSDPNWQVCLVLLSYILYTFLQGDYCLLTVLVTSALIVLIHCGQCW